MGALHSRWHNGNLLFYDTYMHRLVDAVGADVFKWNLDTVYLPVDDTTTDPVGYTMTVVETGGGDSLVALTDGKFVLTTDAAEDDGINLQLKGEAFDLADNNLVYYGIKFRVSDATQSDFIVGLCITNTALLGGMTDGVYFRKVDGSTDVKLVLEKNSTETESAAIATAADATDMVLEFVFDGANIDSWVNGVQQTRLAQTNLPDDEQLTPSIHFLTGAAAAKTMSVAWARAIQVNA